MIEVVADHARYVFGTKGRRHIALEGCSFEASSGEIVGIVGPNGAGKTTMLQLIAGERVPTSGTVRVGGRAAATRVARRMVGCADDPPVLPGELTGVEWLKYLASHRVAHPGERAALLQWAIDSGDLEGVIGRRIGEYSRGMVQRLALATAAVAGPEVIVIDEGLSGIDPLVARRLRTQIEKLAFSGRLIIIATHDLAALERLATRVLVLWNGRLIADVCVATLLRERVAELSLSGSGLSNCHRLLERFSGSARTGDGVAIPLIRGRTIEETLAACRAERIPVAASRIRYRALEDILVDAAREKDGRSGPI